MPERQTDVKPPELPEDPLHPELLAPRWVGVLFLFLAAALVPWTVYLALTLPSHTEATHYDIAWVGFDAALLLALGRTAWLAIKGKRQMEASAIVTATLLAVDAWFDVVTSKAGAPRMEALFLAIFVELPTAFFALYLSRRVEQVVDTALRDAIARRRRLQRRLRRRLSSHGPSASDERTRNPRSQKLETRN